MGEYNFITIFLIKLTLMKFIFSKKVMYVFIIILSLVFLFYYYYYGIFKYGYAVPPGDDGLRHMTEAKYIMQTGYYTNHPGSTDPPLFHILLTILSAILGKHLVSITIFFTPFLTILSIFSIYFITRRYFNKTLAIIALSIFVFISPNLFGLYEDGTYLDLISAEFFLIFTISFLPFVFKNLKNNVHYKNIALILVFAGSTILAHSLSIVYLLMILFIYFLLLVYWYFTNAKNRKIITKYILIIYLTVIMLLFFVWNYYFEGAIGRLFKTFNFIKTGNQTNIKLNSNDIFFSIPTNFNGYVKAYSFVVILLAIAGLICLFFSFILKFKFYQNIINIFKPYHKLLNNDLGNNVLSNKNKIFEILMLIVWIGILIMGSRFSFFIYPSRLLGDAIIPVCILSAIFVYFLIIYYKNNFKRYFIVVLFIIFILFFAINKLNQASKYQLQVRIQKSDQEALKWINYNTKPEDTILVMPKTIINGSWGSYIDLFTDRRAFDGSICPKYDDNKCDPIYKPNSEISIEYYINNSIDYVYAGKKIMGEFVWKNSIDWSYQDKLSKASFLEKIVEFKENKELGSIIIFKVNHQKLNNLLSFK